MTRISASLPSTLSTLVAYQASKRKDWVLLKARTLQTFGAMKSVEVNGA